jgi:RNA polymerase sigma-70 factor, ECF subfamily
MSSLQQKIKEKHLLYKVLEKKDSEAYAALYDLYIEKIYRFVLFKVGSREEAEDLTSDVFLRVWNYLIERDGENITSISGLFYTTARNIIIDHYRQRAKKQTCSIDHVAEFVSDNITPKEKIELQQEADVLLNSVKLLKQEYQEVILLRFIDELSIAEISKILNKKKTNVRVTLHRAIKKLQIITEN